MTWTLSNLEVVTGDEDWKCSRQWAMWWMFFLLKMEIVKVQDSSCEEEQGVLIFNGCGNSSER